MCQAPAETKPRSLIAPKRLARFVALFHHRWAVTVLAELHRLGGGKYVTLVNRLGVSRGALSQTLNHLIDERLAMRNPGYGHPLRPEYVLTKRGLRVGRDCISLSDRLAEVGIDATGLRKWSGAALLSVADGCDRFGEIRDALHGVTDRALTLALKDLAAAGLLERRILDAYPPQPVYALTRTGAALEATLRELLAAFDRP
jgi:DNA-binding HxlR family transcriptional regulator